MWVENKRAVRSAVEHVWRLESTEAESPQYKYNRESKAKRNIKPFYGFFFIQWDFFRPLKLCFFSYVTKVKQVTHTVKAT